MSCEWVESFISAFRLNGKPSPRDHSKLKALAPLATSNALIIGNGPSLVKHDFGEVGRLPTFASNGIYYLFDRTKWRPDYYCCLDSAVLPDQAGEINRWVRRLRGTKFLFPEFIRVHDGSDRGRVPVAEIIKPRRNVYFFKPQRVNLDGDPFEAFAPPDVDYVINPMTVSITLMQLAVKLGARRLFLIGCDTEYSIPANARILDQESERVDKRIILDADNDPNHFDPRYFGKGRVWHSPNVHLMIKHYEQAKEACHRLGVEVYNAGIGGALEVFPRITLKEAIAMSGRPYPSK